MDAILATAAKLVVYTGVLLGLLSNHGSWPTLQRFLYALVVLAPRVAAPAFAVTIAYDVALRCASYRREPTILGRQFMALGSVLVTVTTLFAAHWIVFASDENPGELFDAEYGSWWPWTLFAALLLPWIHPRRPAVAPEPATNDPSRSSI